MVHHKNFNKEIYCLGLVITTKCNLRCHYCYVKKNNRIIPYFTAIKAINFLLNSPGNQKLLAISGGEPILFFDLVKKLINFAQKKAKKLKKTLIISLSSNGTLLSQEQLDFFKKANSKLAISIDGQKKFHNKARVFKNQNGSFDTIFKKIPLVLKNIKKENLCTLFGIVPSLAYKMYDNFIYLTKLGFDSINIEPIDHPKFKWNLKQKKEFLINFIKIIKYIYKNIYHGNFIFLNSINQELKNKRLSSIKKMCPFFENLRICPDGEMAFSPFLINSQYKNQYIVGNINKELSKKYRFCKFIPTNENCQKCWQHYLKNKEDSWGGNSEDVLKWRDFYSIYLSQRILTMSKNQAIFKQYIQEAKKRIFE